MTAASFTRALARAAAPGAFASPLQPIDPGEFSLAGLCYCNADIPLVFVPGPLADAVNSANQRDYLYSAYIAGLIPGRTRRGKEDLPWQHDRTVRRAAPR